MDPFEPMECQICHKVKSILYRCPMLRNIWVCEVCVPPEEELNKEMQKHPILSTLSLREEDEAYKKQQMFNKYTKGNCTLCGCEMVNLLGSSDNWECRSCRKEPGRQDYTIREMLDSYVAINNVPAKRTGIVGEKIREIGGKGTSALSIIMFFSKMCKIPNIQILETIYKHILSEEGATIIRGVGIDLGMEAYNARIKDKAVGSNNFFYYDLMIKSDGVFCTEADKAARENVPF